ncbi:MAG: DNA-processing protein DprA [Bacteroidales bacterium]|nr:DNA-processing protein DprA [Bacteroidales bacterium]
MSDQLIYQIGITLLPGIGDISAKKLIAYCGGAKEVFDQTKTQLLRVEGIGSKLAEAISNQSVLSRAEKEVKFIEKNAIQTFFYLDEDYPQRLKHAMDSPIMLYFKGKADLNQSKILSIVGTRKVTENGKAICDQIIADFKTEQLLIVSGLAYGVDTQAHKSSVENGLATVGVLAHGLDRLYPSANKALAKKMLESGGLLTDFPSETNPDAPNFPRRNRIIAGLSDATLVVESAEKGGSLITAEIANGYNRDVFAVPGRPGDAYSKGTNFLIKTNRAALVESAADIRYQMGWDQPTKDQVIQQKLFVELSPDEELLLKIIQNQQEIPIDLIAIQSKMPMSKVSATLLNMEFAGLIRCLPGKVYKVV